MIAELLSRLSMGPVGTAPELITSVERRFGSLTVDLAASASDTKAPRWVDEAHDSLSPACDWAVEVGDGLGWLNPPVGDMTRWAAKCAASCRAGTRILLLTQAAIDSGWFWAYVWPYAQVNVLIPRLNYEGAPYPLVLSAYNIGPPGELSPWYWEQE